MKTESRTIGPDPDFPGFTRQDICEQVRSMHAYLDCGLNPFTGTAYGPWETHRYAPADVDAAALEMEQYCIE